MQFPLKIYGKIYLKIEIENNMIHSKMMHEGVWMSKYMMKMRIIMIKNKMKEIIMILIYRPLEDWVYIRHNFKVYIKRSFLFYF